MFPRVPHDPDRPARLAGGGPPADLTALHTAELRRRWLGAVGYATRPTATPPTPAQADAVLGLLSELDRRDALLPRYEPGRGLDGAAEVARAGTRLEMLAVLHLAPGFPAQLREAARVEAVELVDALHADPVAAPHARGVESRFGWTPRRLRTPMSVAPAAATADAAPSAPAAPAAASLGGELRPAATPASQPLVDLSAPRRATRHDGAVGLLR